MHCRSHDGIYFVISKGKTLFSDIASAISHRPQMRTWKYKGGEYKSSLSFKPETINIRWNSLNERNKNGKWTRRSFASGKDHANGYESAFAFIRLIFASLAQYFQDLMDTVFKLFSLKVYVSLWIYKKKYYMEMASMCFRQWASWIRSWRAICVQVKAKTINSKSERKAGNTAKGWFI